MGMKQGGIMNYWNIDNNQLIQLCKEVYRMGETIDLTKGRMIVMCQIYIYLQVEFDGIGIA